MAERPIPPDLAASSSALARPVPPPIWLIALAVSSAVMGLTLLTPALPLVQKEFAASSSAVQQLLTVYMVALALGQLVYGTVSDRVGRRPVLLFGSLLFCVGGLAGTLAPSIEILTVCRVIQGLGAAACMSMGRAVVNDCFERTDAARHMSTVSILIAIVPMLSFLLGGLLTQTTGWAGIMLMTAVGGFLVFLPSWFKLNETNLHLETAPFSLISLCSTYAKVMRNKLFVLFALASGMQVGMFFALNGFLPYQYERHGYSPVEFGLWFSLTPICYLLGNLLNGYYLVSRGIERAAMMGASLTLVSVLLLFASQAMGEEVIQAIGLSSALALALPCCLFGFSNGIVVANSTVGAMSAAGRDAGTGIGLAGAWQMAAGGIAGAIIVALGGAQNFLIGAGGLIVMSLVSFFSMLAIIRMRPENTHI